MIDYNLLVFPCSAEKTNIFYSPITLSATPEQPCALIGRITIRCSLDLQIRNAPAWRTGLVAVESALVACLLVVILLAANSNITMSTISREVARLLVSPLFALAARVEEH